MLSALPVDEAEVGVIDGVEAGWIVHQTSLDLRWSFICLNHSSWFALVRVKTGCLSPDSESIL